MEIKYSEQIINLQIILKIEIKNNGENNIIMDFDKIKEEIMRDIENEILNYINKNAIFNI